MVCAKIVIVKHTYYFIKIRKYLKSWQYHIKAFFKKSQLEVEVMTLAVRNKKQTAVETIKSTCCHLFEPTNKLFAINLSI